MVLQYFIINKPFRVLSQFSPEKENSPGTERKATLKDLFKLPADVYPVGRLDYDSEGLLILTNDSSINFRLLNPAHKHEREYWVQVEGEITSEALRSLSSGVTISIDAEKVFTRKARASKFSSPPNVPDRVPPIRYRKNIPDSWLALSLYEGKNRQVRKMTAAVGFPTLRLIRYRIEAITIDGLLPGDLREIPGREIQRLLFRI
ncbi:MAG: pseudouridine synthase [Chitinophagaceae bacterium]